MLRTLLMVMLLGLSAAAYLLLTAPTGLSPATNAREGASTTLALATPAVPAAAPPLPALESLPTTIGRPLFSPTRRPVEAVVEAPTTTAEPTVAAQPEAFPVAPPAFTLSAVFRTAVAEVVLLHDHATGETRGVRLGEEFGGWQVEAIAAQQVTVVKNGTRHTIEMAGSSSSLATGPETTPAPLPMELLRSAPSAGPALPTLPLGFEPGAGAGAAPQ